MLSLMLFIFAFLVGLGMWVVLKPHRPRWKVTHYRPMMDFTVIVIEEDQRDYTERAWSRNIQTGAQCDISVVKAKELIATFTQHATE